MASHNQMGLRLVLNRTELCVLYCTVLCPVLNSTVLYSTPQSTVQFCIGKEFSCLLRNLRLTNWGYTCRRI